LLKYDGHLACSSNKDRVSKNYPYWRLWSWFGHTCPRSGDA